MVRLYGEGKLGRLFSCVSEGRGEGWRRGG